MVDHKERTGRTEPLAPSANGSVRQRDALVRLAAGVAAYPTHALEADQVLHRAKGALESARASGSSRVEVASAD